MKDLHTLQVACKNVLPTLTFKELCCAGTTADHESIGDYSNRLFVKLNEKCQQIERNYGLKYVIQIYGVFAQKQSRKAFLQMEVLETTAEN